MDKIYLLQGLDAVVITSNSNLFYFTGYSNADAVVILSKEKNYYVTDKRSLEEARETISGFEFVDSLREPRLKIAKELLKKLRARRVGYEDGTITLTEYREIARLPRLYVLKGVQDRICALRASKNDIELEKIKKAQAITDEIYTQLLGFIEVGMREKDVANFINKEIYARGATLAFDTIVAFGKNTAKPHAHPSDNVLQKNDVVTVDFGAKLDGYCSDMTRSFAVGKVSDEYVKVYDAVLRAQEYAIANSKAGITKYHGLAVESLKKDGLDNYFTHSLGHSLGIDIHEGFKGAIPLNAVLSVEPGVYIEGKFGVRIEDIVVFKKDNVYNLTNSPKKLIILKK